MPMLEWGRMVSVGPLDGGGIDSIHVLLGFLAADEFCLVQGM